MAVVHQFFSDDTTDIPRASGDEHTHATNLHLESKWVFEGGVGDTEPSVIDLVR